MKKLSAKEIREMLPKMKWEHSECEWQGHMSYYFARLWVQAGKITIRVFRQPWSGSYFPVGEIEIPQELQLKILEEIKGYVDKEALYGDPDWWWWTSLTEETENWLRNYASQ